MTTPAKEIRETVEGLELRAAPKGSKSPGTLVGYAAKYEKYSCDLGYFREKLKPGCFDSAMARNDVRALYNHEPGCLLGRISAGTLRLTSDETGLRMECDLPDTPTGREVAELVRRGDLQGQSFSFTIAKDGDTWDRAAEPWLRTVNEVAELFDVGPVAFPAYEDTSVAMRQYRDAKSALETPPPPDHSLARARDSARLQLLEVS